MNISSKTTHSNLQKAEATIARLETEKVKALNDIKAHPLFQKSARLMRRKLIAFSGLSVLSIIAYISLFGPLQAMGFKIETTTAISIMVGASTLLAYSIMIFEIAYKENKRRNSGSYMSNYFATLDKSEEVVSLFQVDNSYSEKFMRIDASEVDSFYQLQELFGYYDKVVSTLKKELSKKESLRVESVSDYGKQVRHSLEVKAENLKNAMTLA
jgi:hypothetical protein